MATDRLMYAALLTLNSKLNRIITMLGGEVMPELDALSEQVGRLESVADQAVAKIQQLIEQGGGNVDPAQLQQIADRVKAVADKLEGASAEEQPPA